ncbi:MAG: pseudouridine synthase [Methanomassiliicoccus sp.]|nr:pseudouridine synthase [Methanomassiliicoccus sp.]
MAGSAFEGERIAKVLARAGVCSRRDAERFIADGRVAVDGKVLTSPALNVTDEATITVDGRPLRTAERTRVWRYHKPTGTITTAKDPKGRPTVFENLPPEMPRVVSVGRLDVNTEGLLLLTNDGELARHLELPHNAWPRRYRVRVQGDIGPEKFASVANGVTIAGIRYEPVKIEIEEGEEAGTGHWLVVTIHEGKNREVRNIMAHLGLQVKRLIRVSFGPFSLDKLPRGGVEEVPPPVLRRSLEKYLDERNER